MESKRPLVLVTIFVLLTSTIFTSNTHLPLNGSVAPQQSVIYVPDNYAKIQDAVNNAPEGSTVIVRDGTYVENVIVSERLTIVSQNGPSRTLVRAADPGQPVFRVTNYTSVKIIGFTISGAFNSSGIYLDRASNSIIMNNNIVNNQCGIYLYTSDSNTIALNTISNTMCGIYLEQELQQHSISQQPHKPHQRYIKKIY